MSNGKGRAMGPLLNSGARHAGETPSHPGRDLRDANASESICQPMAPWRLRRPCRRAPRRGMGGRQILEVDG